MGKPHSARSRVRVFRRSVRRLWLDRHATLIVTAFVVGTLAGIANIVFRTVLHAVRDLVFVGGQEALHIAGGGPAKLLLPLLPVSGALVIVLISLRFPGEIAGYTFHRFLETVNIKGGVLRARNLVFQTIGPALTIGTGGSAGVEGPIATIGGTIGSLIGQATKSSERRTKLLIASGSAAAIAATFNAPIAGVMFAIEIVLLGSYELTSFAAIIVSAGIATVISRGYYGPNPLFTVPAYHLRSAYEIPLYLLLGLVVGVLAVYFIRSFYGIKDIFSRSRMHPLARPVAGAFIVGTIGIMLPEVMSDGYGSIEDALDGGISAPLVAALVVFKVLATSVTLGSGGAGGVFAPALFIGAMAGASFGYGAGHLFPDVTAAVGAYATVGIGAFLAAATHAPLTGIFLVFELTGGDYQIIVPVMFASIIATVVSKRLSDDSIDTVELTREGVDIHAGREVALMSRIKVRSVMDRDFVTVPRDIRLSELVRVMISNKRFYLPVVDGEGRMAGIISIHDVRPVLLDEKVKGVVKAGDLATESVITLFPDDDLGDAAESFALKDIDEIPVVARDDPRRVIGMIGRADVFAAYNKEVLKRESGF